MSQKISFTIAELADQFGVTARAIRFYETKGLIKPTRKGQSRIYSIGDQKRLAWILRGKRVGFSLEEIGELLDLYDPEGDRYHQKLVTLERCQQRIIDLKSQRHDIDATLAELAEFCQNLQQRIDQDHALDAAASLTAN
jgi:DNA-binding transcriptional MerR regulator